MPSPQRWRELLHHPRLVSPVCGKIIERCLQTVSHHGHRTILRGRAKKPGGGAASAHLAKEVANTLYTCTMAFSRTALLKPIVVQSAERHTASLIFLHGSGKLLHMREKGICAVTLGDKWSVLQAIEPLWAMLWL